MIGTEVRAIDPRYAAWLEGIHVGQRFLVLDHWQPKRVGHELTVVKVWADGQGLDFRQDDSPRICHAPHPHPRHVSIWPDAIITFRCPDGRFWTWEELAP